MNNKLKYFGMKWMQILFLLGISSFITTCKKDHLLDCITSSGDIVSEFRPATPFVRVEMEDHVDLVIHKSTKPSIRVTAGSHLIDGIITELSNGVLYIRNENRCNWVRSFKNQYTVDIGIDSLQSIATFGNGNITCADTLSAYEFTFDSWNASGSMDLLLHCERSHLNNNTGRIDMRASGIVGVSYIAFNDVGILDAGKLVSDLTYMRNNSTGELRVCATHELQVEIRYTGNVYYTGNPYRIEEDRSGTGQLIPF